MERKGEVACQLGWHGVISYQWVSNQTAAEWWSDGVLELRPLGASEFALLARVRRHARQSPASDITPGSNTPPPRFCLITVRLITAYLCLAKLGRYPCTPAVLGQ